MEIEKVAYDNAKAKTHIDFVKELNESLMYDLREDNKPSRDIESQLKKGHSRLELYDFIYCMSYITPLFQLQMSGKTLSSLSPGERGAILLLFYLFIDNDDKPLIIDQPEENLDNQSVFKYLVAFIKAAKKKRQIIMITHQAIIASKSDRHFYVRKTQDEKTSVNIYILEGENKQKAIAELASGKITEESMQLAATLMM